ncbi:hypothetical protein MRQ36_29005 [Micromonospora sp. R77]|nr:hypothetical protein [Micromonospora sp. R77]
MAAAFTLAGFAWWEGYARVVERYHQGWAADRPYALGLGEPGGAAALGGSGARAGGAAPLRAGRLGRWGGTAGGARVGRWWSVPADRVRALGPTVALPAAAALAVVAADLSGMSKAEVERIWLPFVVWALVATAHLPALHRRWWLAGQAATALAVNHLP